MQNVSDIGEHRPSLLPITLTELILIMFFLLLLLFITRLAESSNPKRFDQMRSENASLRKTNDHLHEALKEIHTTLGDQKQEVEHPDFVELVRNAKTALENQSRNNNDLKEARQKIEKLSQSNKELSKISDTQKGQLAHYQRRSGRGGQDIPPCWPTPDGKADFIYDITIRETDIKVSPGWPPHREKDLDEIPGSRDIILPSVSEAMFRKLATPILNWSNKKTCRHYVRIYDETETKVYKRRRLVIEDYFYKWESRG